MPSKKHHVFQLLEFAQLLLKCLIEIFIFFLTFSGLFSLASFMKLKVDCPWEQLTVSLLCPFSISKVNVEPSLKRKKNYLSVIFPLEFCPWQHVFM